MPNQVSRQEETNVALKKFQNWRSIEQGEERGIAEHKGEKVGSL